MNDDDFGAEAFNDPDYLRANPDVCEAVSQGRFRSGRHHWDSYGQAEGRPLALLHDPADRRHKLLGGLDIRRMLGVEIGALTQPLVRKTETEEGGRIFYVDHADTETLRLKYLPTEINLADLVEVDFVWGENTLEECLGLSHQADYVLASHVVEHVPDLITWLAEIRAVLKPEGHLRMAIPDRRFTFDVLRRESTLADALDAYVQRARRPLPRAILDHFLNVAPVDALTAWRGALSLPALRPDHTREDALQKAERSFHADQYQDTHCWVFTPVSFAELCVALAEMGKLHLSCVEVYSTEYRDLEFIAALRPARDEADCLATWQAMAHRLRALGRLSAPLAPR